MSAINEVWKTPQYSMVHLPDDTWCIVKGWPHNNPPIIKDNMTKEEAQMYMKLLRG